MEDKGLTILCGNCGGNMELDFSRGIAECSYCRRKQILSPEMVEKIRDYQSQMTMSFNRVAGYKSGAGAFERYLKSYRGITVFILLVVALILILSFGASILTARNAGRGVIYNFKNVHQIMAVLFVLVLAGVSWGYSMWISRSKRGVKKEDVVPETLILCPGCGAPNKISAGGVIEKCSYCHCSIVMSAGAMKKSIEKMSEEEMKSALEYHRVRREAYIKALKWDVSGIIPYFYIVPSIFGAVIWGLAVLWQILKREEPFDIGMIVAPWVFLLILIAILAGVILWRRHVRNRWETALNSISMRFGGKAVWGIKGVIDWLNRHWAGDYSEHDLRLGIYGCGVEFSIDGFPCFLIANPVKRASISRRGYAIYEFTPHIHLLVGAWTSNFSDRIFSDANAKLIVNEINKSGFEVSLNKFGIFAKAKSEVIKNIRKKPERIYGVAQLSLHLVNLAKMLGAVPVNG